jgi:large subunit ribosomal protein L29
VKASEFRGLTEVQLQEQLTDLHTEWRNLRFQEAIGKLTATARVRQIRKDIARIHTIRTERELDEALRSAIGSGSGAR